MEDEECKETPYSIDEETEPQSKNKRLLIHGQLRAESAMKVAEGIIAAHSALSPRSITCSVTLGK